MCLVRSYTAQYYSSIYLVVAPDVIEKIYFSTITEKVEPWFVKSYQMIPAATERPQSLNHFVFCSTLAPREL